MQLRVLGPVEAFHDARPIEVAGARRRSVLATLALRPGDVVSVDKIIDAVWEDDPPVTARNTVQAHVSALRKILGDQSTLLSRPPGYVLALPAPATDLAVVQALLAQVDRIPDPAERVELLTEALGHWHGVPLANTAPSAYLSRHADSLLELQVTTRENLVINQLKLGEHRAVIPILQEMTAHDPLRERPVQLLMTALYRAGRTSEALAAYRNLTGILQRELGAEPGPRTTSLFHRVREHDLALLGSRKQPVPPTAQRPRRAPVVTTGGRVLRRLVGRQKEIDRALQALRRERLLTLVGMGGVGKTRLAWELLGRFSGRTDGRLDDSPPRMIGQAVDLTAVQPDQMVEMVAASIGVVQEPGVPIESTLAAALRGPPGALGTVLLLDNCDHLIEQAAALVVELIGRTDTLKVIVTSREPLHTDGEVCLTLSPLADADALTLLTERARAADTAFERSPHNEAALAELCRGVGGLPLALEILGPRLRTHTAAELVDVLDRRVLSWSDTRRQIADRHRSLRALMEDSVHLLPDSERDALERLSRLEGGAWLDEAALLCHSDPYRGEELIVSLIERSLLTRAEIDDRTRISMHSLVRAYTRERTDQLGHAEEQSARHADWVAGLVAAAAAHWHHPEEVVELRRRRVDEGNTRALLEWTRQHRPERLASLVVQLWWYWFRVGAAAEGRRWVSLAVAAAAPGSRDRAAALAAGGYLAWLVDDYDAARAQAEAALADAAADGRVRGFAHGVVARALGDTGNFSAAADSARLGVREYEQCDDLWGTAWLRRVAAAALFYGKVGAEGEALRECVRSRADFAKADDTWGVAGTLDLESRITAQDGDAVVVRDLAETALALMRQCGDTSGERYALHHLAEVSLGGGLLDVAEQHALEEFALSERHGYQVGALQAALLLEDVTTARGDDTAALEWRRHTQRLTAILGAAAEVSMSIAAERRAAPLPQA